IRQHGTTATSHGNLTRSLPHGHDLVRTQGGRTTPMSFKRSLAILSLSLVTLLVASAAVWAQEPVEIVMWTWFDDSREAFDIIVEQWNSQRDDIKVRHQVFPQTEYLRDRKSVV